MTTTTTPRASHSTAFSRLSSLGMAEGRQFFRNRTLMLMAAMPLVCVIVFYGGLPSDKPLLSAFCMDYLVQFSLLFCVYYPLLSMVTTRRDEKVLKRLRTGECSDAEILLAPALPTVFLSAIVTGAGTVILVSLSGRAPRDPVPLVLAIVLGFVLCWGLALLTSAITRNAEAAQMTSMPALLLAVFSVTSTRVAFPEEISQWIQRTPFAAVSDLVHGGWVGEFVSPAEWGRPLLILFAWAVACCWAGISYMRWENNR